MRNLNKVKLAEDLGGIVIDGEKAHPVLAELEKPTEGVSDDDVIPCVVSNCDYFDIQYLANCCRGKREPVYYLCTDYLQNCKMIKDYAESYHAKKCAECKTIVCPDCKGDGYTSEHDSSANAHDDAGGCLGSCPIQIQCETCNGTGKIFLKEQK